MAEPLIEFQGVRCQYGRNVVLHDINLHLHYGQFVGVLGPSGAGKTTLLKTILGLVKPAAGRVHFSGRSGRGKLQIGYVPQVETVDWNFPLTVEQAVLLGRVRRAGIGPFYRRQDMLDAYKLMEQLGIAAFAKRHIRDLSGGQQQRVFLARALVANPDLLVLDEPTAGVDMRTQEEILHLLADLNKAGVTILLTTHDLNAAAAHLPWVVCLNRTVIAQGTPDDVFTPETLNRAYNGDMIVIKQDGLIFVQERPHWHSHRDVLPDPVLSHPTTTPENPSVIQEKGC